MDCFIITAALKTGAEPVYYRYLPCHGRPPSNRNRNLPEQDDLADREIEAFKEIYEGLYPVMCVSGKTEKVWMSLEVLAGKKSAFGAFRGEIDPAHPW